MRYIILLGVLSSIFIACSSDPSTSTPTASKTLESSTLCDTTSIQYTQISSIVDQNCILCHSSSMQSGGIQLDSYSSLVDAIENHNLLSSIEQTGNKPMPPSGKLDDCSLAKFKSWIGQDMPK